MKFSVAVGVMASLLALAAARPNPMMENIWSSYAEEQGNLEEHTPEEGSPQVEFELPHVKGHTGSSLSNIHGPLGTNPQGFRSPYVRQPGYQGLPDTTPEMTPGKPGLPDTTRQGFRSLYVRQPRPLDTTPEMVQEFVSPYSEGRILPYIPKTPSTSPRVEFEQSYKERAPNPYIQLSPNMPYGRQPQRVMFQ